VIEVFQFLAFGSSPVRQYGISHDCIMHMIKELSTLIAFTLNGISSVYLKKHIVVASRQSLPVFLPSFCIII
jgi:hypothetical protein